MSGRYRTYNRSGRLSGMFTRCLSRSAEGTVENYYEKNTKSHQEKRQIDSAMVGKYKIETNVRIRVRDLFFKSIV